MAFWKRGSEAPPVTIDSQNNSTDLQSSPTFKHTIDAERSTQNKSDYAIPQSSADTLRPDPLEEDLLRRFGRIRTALSQGTTIQGKLSFDSPVRIDGKLSGDVFSSHVLLVGGSAEVCADIEAETVVILGKVKGNIKAKTKIEIFIGAKVEASISAPSLILQEGALLSGRCRIKA